MRLVFLAIVLAFPLIDLWVTARFAQWTGVPLWFWLVSSAGVGLWLMRNERMQFHTRTVAAMHGEYSLLRGLVDSGRKVLAGMLLIMPGVLSDLLALLLLLLPINQRGGFGPTPVAASRMREIVDPEYRRIE